MDGRGLGVIAQETDLDETYRGLEELIADLTDSFPTEMVRECLDDLNYGTEEDSGDTNENFEEFPIGIGETREAYENLHIRLIIYQLKTLRGEKIAIRTLTQHKSNLNAILPEKAYRQLLKKLEKLGNITRSEYEKDYRAGLVEMLRQGVKAELESKSSPATKRSRLYTARLFLRSQMLDEYLGIAPFNAKIKIKAKRPVCINHHEFQKFIRTIENAPEPPKNSHLRKITDLCYFMLIRNTGAMPHEINELRCSDFKQRERLMKLAKKDGKKRTLLLDTTTYNYLMEYLKTSNTDSGPVDENGPLLKNIGARYMRKRFSMYAEMAGLQRRDFLSPKALRYAFARRKIRQGRRADSKELSRCLGISTANINKLISFYRI